MAKVKAKNVVPAAVVEAEQHNVEPMDAKVLEALVLDTQAKIADVCKADGATKNTIGELSRSIPELIVLRDTGSIGLANALIEGLQTPSTVKAVTDFFRFFLPYEFDENTGTFGKMMDRGSRKFKAKVRSLREFMGKPENTVWTWYTERQAANRPAKKPDYAKGVERAVKIALNGKKDKETGEVINEPLNPAVVLRAVMAGGMPADELERFAKTIHEQIEALANPLAQIN